MRLFAAIIVAVLLGCAMLAANAHKPFETVIDPQSPGVWPQYAAANNAEMLDQYTCMRLLIPYEVTTERRERIVKT